LNRHSADPPLSNSSLKWLAETDPDRRRQYGQYLTPQPVAEALVDRVPLAPGIKVLDPGVGTGELLAAVARREPRAELNGWDIDQSALAAAQELVPGAVLELRSALDPLPRLSPATHRDCDPEGQITAEAAGPARTPGAHDPGRADSGVSGPAGVGAGTHARSGFDLVIANPPYFQVPATRDLKDRFGEVISGRPNIFAFFFKAGLDLLRPGGRLAFVVPPSMNSGAYFEGLREHIASCARITDLTVLEGSGLFEGANTAAQLIVLEKYPASGPVGSGGDASAGSGEPAVAGSGSDTHGRDFIFEHREPGAGFRRVVFTEDPGLLRAGFDGRRTLWQLGFEAVTGNVVWNQRRADLRRAAGTGTVPLIWSRDLRGGTFDPSVRPPAPAAGKAGHIISERRMTGPALLVNRVIGAVGRGQLRTCFVPAGVPFLAENHVNVICRRGVDTDLGRRSRVPGAGSPPGKAVAEDKPAGIDWQELQTALETPGAGDRARILTGNTQLSATELTHLLPV
jgi:adenine-specific DNA-methyltransferase